jgi:hypothetical protein
MTDILPSGYKPTLVNGSAMVSGRSMMKGLEIDAG